MAKVGVKGLKCHTLISFALLSLIILKIVTENI